MSRFLIRRAFKIYPAFWAWIAATLTLGWIGFPGVRGGNTWSELLFVQNYFSGLWNHTWSLAVEENFYLLLAAIVTFLIYRKRSGEDPLAAMPAIFCVIAVVCLMLRVITTYYMPYQHGSHLFPTHLRIDSLMFGVWLAYHGTEADSSNLSGSRPRNYLDWQWNHVVTAGVSISAGDNALDNGFWIREFLCW